MHCRMHLATTEGRSDAARGVQYQVTPSGQRNNQQQHVHRMNLHATQDRTAEQPSTMATNRWRRDPEVCVCTPDLGRTSAAPSDCQGEELIISDASLTLFVMASTICPWPRHQGDAENVVLGHAMLVGENTYGAAHHVGQRNEYTSLEIATHMGPILERV